MQYMQAFSEIPEIFQIPSFGSPFSPQAQIRVTPFALLSWILVNAKCYIGKCKDIFRLPLLAPGTPFGLPVSPIMGPAGPLFTSWRVWELFSKSLGRLPHERQRKVVLNSPGSEKRGQAMSIHVSYCMGPVWAMKNRPCNED